MLDAWMGPPVYQWMTWQEIGAEVADGPERHPPYDILPIDPTLTTASGSLASPLGADAAKGEMLTRRTIGHFIDILDREFPSPVPALRIGSEDPFPARDVRFTRHPPLDPPPEC